MILTEYEGYFREFFILDSCEIAGELADGLLVPRGPVSTQGCYRKPRIPRRPIRERWATCRD
jgi:hypothetical protein